MWTYKKCGEEIEDQFDSCWKCSERTEKSSDASIKPLKWSDYLLAASMSYALAWLALFLNSILLPDGWRKQHTLLYRYSDHIDKPDIWIAMALPAAITFLILIPFLRSRTACWLVCVIAGAVWMSLLS